jgi:hypothetical protein
MAADPEQLNDSVVFGQFAGLRNTVAQVRLSQNELADAVNIDIDDAQQARRRRGYTKVADGDFHSTKTVAGRTFAVRDSDLVEITAGYAITVLRTDVGPQPLDYVEVNGVVYFSSSTASGKIMPDGTVEDWGALAAENEWFSPVVNPTETLPDLDGKLLGPPPLAEHLTLHNGRIYLATKNIIWATELYLYDYVDKTRNFMQFESDVTGLIAVDDGIYVGTADAVWFLTGGFGSMRRVAMTPQGMVARSAVEVPADALALQQPTAGHAVMFMSRSDVCIGLAGGVCYTVTQGKFLLPEASSGAAMYRKQDGLNQYVGVLDSAGGPKSAARFGDYVDAEIRRFEGV